jgi:hypothetical protein
MPSRVRHDGGNAESQTKRHFVKATMAVLFPWQKLALKQSPLRLNHLTQKLGGMSLSSEDGDSFFVE